MQSGETEIAKKSRRGCLKSANQFWDGKVHPRRSHQPFANPDKNKYEHQLQGGNEPVDELDDRLVQFQPDPRDGAEGRGRAENWENSEIESQRYGQGNSLRGKSLRELGDDQSKDSLAPEFF